MELKTVVSQFLYRIEPKPGGGFIATSKGATLPPIEGATREEVQQKIQDRINVQLAAQLPALKSALAANDVKLHYHIDAKPGGGYIVHRGDPSHEPIEGSTREHVENLIESKIVSMIMKQLPPELSKEVTEKLNSGGLDVVVDRKVSVTTNRSVLTAGAARGGAYAPGQLDAGEIVTPSAGSLDPSPVTRYEKSPVGSFIRFLLAVGVLALLIYLVLHRR